MWNPGLFAAVRTPNNFEKVGWPVDKWSLVRVLSTSLLS